MPSLDELPDLPPSTFTLVIALVLTFWLSMRIRILRRMEAHRQEGDAPVPAWAWMRRLAATSWILPALAVLGVVLAAAVAATFLRQ